MVLTKYVIHFTGEIIMTYDKHGMHGTKPYMVWNTMKCRCCNPNDARWDYYGGRGIKVCKKWMRFIGFWEDMGSSYKEGLSLERRDNNKGYSKSNCYWATQTQQLRNTRRNRYINTQWGKLCVSEAAIRSELNVATVFHRIRSGWSPDRLLISTKSRSS